MRKTIAGALLALASAAAFSQPFPQKQVRLIAPYAPGGTVDAVARTLSIRLSQEFGQQVIVENRAGASGNIGAEFVSQSSPDGHTLLLTSTTVIVNPYVMKDKPPFDLMKDFTHLAMVASTPLVFVVGPGAAVNNVKEFIAMAKSQPDKVSFGVGGFGSGGHLAMESFNVRAGVAIPMVIYKGSAPALTDIMGGRVSGMMDPVLTTLPFVNAGRMKAIAVTGSKRSALLPAVPTMEEAGLSGIDFVSWYGLWGPANLPAPVSERVQAAVQKSLETAEFKEWLLKQGMEPGAYAGARFKTFVEGEAARYAKVVTDAKIEPK